MKSLFSKEEIELLIPHRDPFLLVDGVLDFKKSEEITAFKYIKNDDLFMKGHFPNMQVFPGVLIVEALAQSGAILSELSRVWSPEKGITLVEDDKIAIMGEIKVNFLRTVQPECVLNLNVKLSYQFGDACYYDIKAYNDHDTIVKGSFTGIKVNKLTIK